MAMHLMMENTEVKERTDLVRRLTGPFRTMGKKISREDLNAPSWWHGDEEAFASVEILMMQIPQRGRGA